MDAPQCAAHRDAERTRRLVEGRWNPRERALGRLVADGQKPNGIREQDRRRRAGEDEAEAVAQDRLGHRLGLVLTGSAAAVLFAYAVRFLAVGYQTTESALARIPPTLDEAARSLGVTMRGALRRVHLPLMRGGILSALTLIWVETIKELPATLLLRPFGLKTLAIEVWERTSESLWAEAALPALAIVGVGLVPLLLGSRLDAGRR